ncbi:MAG: LCP family protein, partial [Chloroflexi bacterium]|nr:LCP family protein [Chloroflexota bacterium]
GSVKGVAGVGPDWRNKERVNILVMGIDRRPDEPMDGPNRTDTMMVLTIDPAGHSAGMLGLPRDLLVPIAMPSKDCNYLPWGNPYAQDRINTAFLYGTLCGYTGPGGSGGPGLAKDTIQYNFGVHIHYYATLDFDGFERLIDALGGVDVTLKESLIDNEYPTPDYGIMRINIPKGPQHLNGERALWFARSRHMDSDFGRINRQQQLLLAVRERALRLDMAPRYPQLIQLLSQTVKTDMSVGELLLLALAAREVPTEAIVNRAVAFPLVSEITGADGAALLMPNRALIRPVINEVFHDTRLAAEAAHIEILNGAGVEGLATRTADLLKDRGFGEVTVGNSTDGAIHPLTEIYDLSGKSYSATLVAAMLGVSQNQVKAAAEVSAGAAPDIRIILGQDQQFR